MVKNIRELPDSYESQFPADSATFRLIAEPILARLAFLTRQAVDAVNATLSPARNGAPGTNGQLPKWRVNDLKPDRQTCTRESAGYGNRWYAEYVERRSIAGIDTAGRRPGRRCACQRVFNFPRVAGILGVTSRSAVENTLRISRRARSTSRRACV